MSLSHKLQSLTNCYSLGSPQAQFLNKYLLLHCGFLLELQGNPFSSTWSNSSPLSHFGVCGVASLILTPLSYSAVQHCLSFLKYTFPGQPAACPTALSTLTHSRQYRLQENRMANLTIDCSRVKGHTVHLVSFIHMLSSFCN